jgi:hypothetical protein
MTVCVKTEWFGKYSPVLQLVVSLMRVAGVTFPVSVLIDVCSYRVWIPVSSIMHCCKSTMYATVGFRPLPTPLLLL